MKKNVIKNIDDTSPLFGRVKIGDRLLRINGHDIIDVLDYKYFEYEPSLDVEFESGKIHVDKEEGIDLGLDFEEYLMDSPRSCANNCIFCFIDQLPKGLRETLYFKDDDARLSFLLGNYITLTNLSEREIQRIIDLKISPVNISVHTTNPELRVKMLRNKNAGKSIDIIKRFAENGIIMNCQIVCCPGINDNDELLRTMEDLSSLYPQVNSVSVVPVGLTKYRDGLYPITAFTADHAAEIIDIVESFGEKCLEKYGSRIFFCGDEFYLKCKRDIPSDEFYEDYTQLENGVGMIRLLETEFMAALRQSEEPEKQHMFSIACGESVKPLFEKLICTVNAKYGKIKGNVFAIKNDFFGHDINVTGLITGHDLISQLKDKNLGDVLLISQNMLRRSNMDFLDDVTLLQAEQELNIKIVPIEQDGFVLLDAMMGEYLSIVNSKYGE